MFLRLYLPKIFTKAKAMKENRIKEILSSRGLNVSNLADTLGISRQALSRQISGKMLVETAERIADALGVEMWELFADGREIAARYQEQHPTPDALRCPKCGARLTITAED